MRLVTFADDGVMRIGVHDQSTNEIIDLSTTTDLPREMTAFVAIGKSALQTAYHAVKSGKGRLPARNVKFKAPFPRPASNILCVGKNYYDHAQEFHNSGVDASVGSQNLGTLLD